MSHRMFVATESFTTMHLARPYHVEAGRTLVSEDDTLYLDHKDKFRLAEERPDVESATAGPGEKRDVSIGGTTARADTKS